MADDNARHQRNGHTLELDGCKWRCLQCRHVFEAAVDAEAFWCGDPCACQGCATAHRCEAGGSR